VAAEKRRNPRENNTGRQKPSLRLFIKERNKREKKEVDWWRCTHGVCGAEENGFGLVRAQVVDKTGEIDDSTAESDVDLSGTLLDVGQEVQEGYLQKSRVFSDLAEPDQ
jgi:hypothetical protein